MAEKHWVDYKERGSYFGIRILLGFYRLGGRLLVKIGLLPILLYFFLSSRATRSASLDYLGRVYKHFGATPHLQTYPTWKESFLHFWRFGQAAVDKVDAWVGKLRIEDLELGDVSHFESQLSQGKGALLIANHFGNVEVCRALVKERFSVRMNVIVFTEHAANFNRILKDVNPSIDADLIQANAISPDLVIMLKDRVERGECVVIVGDRVSVDSPNNVVWTDFLGKSAPFAIGPWILASVLSCPVYLMSCMQVQGKYRLDLQFLSEEIRIPRRNRNDELAHWVKRYATHLEHLVKTDPLQWYNFYNFWCLPESDGRED
ncbi:LpxL/LpxP family acyltransferase [Aliidiomarina indica]|uniref:LpxL/LpxP family acyltransferase n=1 Tax=Aliidiomarina indica TaxID=2749147 RepID=UPI00188E8FA1|nr:acetyltransferase [Aliidiomarina indica]